MSSQQPIRCIRCDGEMEVGWTSAHGLMGPSRSGVSRLLFVVPGEPTARSPVEAFQQGLDSDTDEERAWTLAGFRCRTCGAVELFATDRATPP